MNEEEQRDEQKLHAQRMESVGQLTGGLAHDFNNLLTVIQGNLQALQDLPSVRADTEGVSLVSAALRATQRGAELTRSLLAFSRRQKLAPAAVDVPALLRSLLGMLRRTVDPRLQLELKAAPSCPPCVADPALLESALLNIALNARDAMPEGGRLSCHVDACAELPLQARADLGEGQRAAEGYLRISMRDTGSGMPEAVRQRAFEPFFTTKEPGRGTGLGLSTAYGFVKQSQGAITLDSSPGAGTCITLYLPLERRAVPRPAAARAASLQALRGVEVMLVEDDLEVMAVSLAFLRHLGCEVRAYASGEHALQALESEAPPALLLSDVTLGEGMRGTVLASEMRLRWPTVAVLLMSGYPPTACELGDPAAAELLAKPFSRDELAQAMLRALGQPNLCPVAPAAEPRR